MNAPERIKPKTLRLAIMLALADGAIATIDDLQTRTDEPRAKIANNAHPMMAEGLIKRLRDDVTGAPAYQITPKGRDYISKHATPFAQAQRPAAATPASDSASASTDDKARRGSEAVALGALEEAMPGFTAEVVGKKDAEIAGLRAQYDEACDLIARMHAAAMNEVCTPVIGAVEDVAAVRARLSHIELMVRNASAETVGSAAPVEELLGEILHRCAQQSSPAGYVIQRPTKPLMRFVRPEKAQSCALSFARGGKRAQVFALIPVGAAVPGAEWRAA